MGLRTYRQKRDFARTPEPRGEKGRSTPAKLAFVVQKHAATRLHHDFRLELDGVLLSWAVPKGPPATAGGKALAVRTEDHPLAYGSFEGVIPKGQYGGGTVMLWDRGTWTPEGDPQRGLADGKLDFTLHGKRLHGRWSLVRMRARPGEKAESWLLVKRTDATATRTRTKTNTVARDLAPPWTADDRSVASGRSMAEIARGTAVWHSRPATAKRAAASARAAPAKKTRASLGSSITLLPGARTASQPRTLQPQLATLARDIPQGDEWLHEVKLDGYRLVAFVDDGNVRLKTRTGQDWTDRFPDVAKDLAALPVSRAIVDGEITALLPDGRSDFQTLQNWLDRRGGASLAYYAFDLPHCDGFDLTSVPLLERKEVLRRVLAARPSARTLRYSDHVSGSGPDFLAAVRARGLEGVVSKRADARYEARRSRTWLKIKCIRRQEMVVGGYTEPAGSRTHFGALLLGVHEDGELVYAGKVGTGFDARSLAKVLAVLQPLRTDHSPFRVPPKRASIGGRAHWVEPKAVVEVAFTEWTSDGRLRHPSFQGLREDKDPRAVAREQAVPAAQPAAPPARADGRRVPATTSRRRGASEDVAGVTITHADRVLFPKLPFTKAELARYYETVGEHLLPHVVNRPLTLVRCPNGPEGECFYQKHIARTLPAPVRAIRVDEGGGAADYVGIDDLKGLVTLVQFGAIELHPWGSRADQLERPDRVIIDLDPGPGVAWARVVAAAVRVHELLFALRLQSFVRTTGGKGLHVVVPIEQRTSWDDVKQFALDVSNALVRTAPDEFLTVATKSKRTGRIFVDFLRNGRGATAVANWSARARPDATVAVPLRWAELGPELDPAAYDVRTAPKLASAGVDPWAGFFDVRQSLSPAVRAAARRL